VIAKLFGRAKMSYRGVATLPSRGECCVGRDLMPRWRSPEHMEDISKAIGFVCHQCGREYLPEEMQGRRLIRDE
jgi:hypothetical protein